MNVLFTGKANLSFYTKQRIGGSSLSGIKLPESISTEQLEEQPENLKLLLLSFSSLCRSSGFFPDECFFFPGEQGLQCLSLGSRNYLLQSRGQQHEAPSNAAEPLLTPPHPHALHTKWSREVPPHCRMSPKKSFRIPRELSAPPVCSVWRKGFGLLPLTLQRSPLCTHSQLSSDSASATHCLWKCFRTNHAFYFSGD